MSKKTAKRQKQKEVDDEMEETSMEEGETSKSHGQILKEQISEGMETYEKSPFSILTSSFAAGLEIGFSFLMLCTLYHFLEGRVGEPVIIKMMALVYPVGFMLVVLGQSILFTEQTALLALPVLNGKQGLASLMRIWGLVIAGNLLGGYLMAGVLLWLGPELGIFNTVAVEKIALHVTDYSEMVIVVSAVLAGWLMALLSWLVTSTTDTISKVVLIFLITGVMAFAGLHHSIIGSIEVFAGWLVSPQIGGLDYLKFEALALVGNAMGGVVFVAMLKYRAFVYDARDY